MPAQLWAVNTSLSVEQRSQLQGEESLLSLGCQKVSNTLERGPRTVPDIPTVHTCIEADSSSQMQASLLLLWFPPDP